MLLVSTISENIEKITKSMLKRNIDIRPVLEKIIKTDTKRRSIQSSLDNSLSDSNQLAKEIGDLYKKGESQQTSVLKEKAGVLKAESKKLSEILTNTIYELNNLLLEVPNIPHKLVPSGSNESDNEEILQLG
ncbi:MAG: serine--tRNA ligase, partial [Flavobacteriaceae bacterium]|nr:serine--tRNA ligase [Flavobacteriaceae bacterium]